MAAGGPISVASTEPKFSLRELSQPYGGLLSPPLPYRRTDADLHIYTVQASVGDITPFLETTVGCPGHRGKVFLSGHGSAPSQDSATTAALAEALERYGTINYQRFPLLRASAHDLGDTALDLDAVPRCSDTELAHPACPIVKADKSVPMDWVLGLSLMDGSPRYIPAVMAFLYLPQREHNEQFWIQITTGCASQRSYEKALLSAMLEVLERDAIALLWLQKLGLPRIEVASIERSGDPLWSSVFASKQIDYHFFDATTDAGVPIVYGVQVAAGHPSATTLVSCACAFDPKVAIAKVLRDMVSFRFAFTSPRQPPANWDDFRSVHDGAHFMAKSENKQAFDFLLNTTSVRKIDAVGLASTQHCLQDDKTRLSWLLQRLAGMGMEAFAVDLTPDEARRAGLRVVRVVIPQLMPLPFVYRARFLGHPRLYSAPRAMGYESRSERNLNHWPQPFA